MSKRDSISCIDAVIEYCEKNGIDLEDVGKKIFKNDLIRSRIELEAEELNYMRKKSRLPL
jgi:hypothetical protein